MQIKQFEDKNLSHYSYAIVSDCEKKIILIDPARDPKPYYDFAREQGAWITGVIETHPHADFVSSHLEIHNTKGATIYASKLVNASYPHQSFDEGNVIEFGKIKLTVLNTPGHSPDSICIVLEHDGKQKAVFTGDTLFIGDCGRPDLREKKEDVKTQREELAKDMYQSLRTKLTTLPDDVTVYPAHGAGTLCGKALSEANSSTIGEEKKTNWSLQPLTEEEFVKELLSDQPFVPAYFSYDVELNKRGAPSFELAVGLVKRGSRVIEGADTNRFKKDIFIIDTRNESDFKKGHLSHSVNLMEGTKFETWLGTIIRPGEMFYLAGADENSLTEMIKRTAVIGYESQIEEAFILNSAEIKDEKIDLEKFKEHTDDYTIVDIRNSSEVKEQNIFPHSISIPLADLRNRVNEIPLDKPIVVHCAGGYRSAAGSSLMKSQLNGSAKVFDLGEAVKEFE